MHAITQMAKAGLLVGILLAVAGIPAAAQFTDVTAEAGVMYTQNGPQLGLRCTITGNTRFTCEPQRMAGGAAVGDYDGDGLDDLFVTRFRLGGILFRNQGDGTFVDMTAAAGITKVDYSNCAVWVDIDHDGDLDLFIGTTGGLRYHLFVNDGTGYFTEQAFQRGVARYTGTPHLNYGIAVGDYDNDGWTDIFVSEWGNPPLLSAPGQPHHSRLFRNRGGNCPGHFIDVTEAAGVNLPDLMPQGFVFGFAPAFVDLDQDGHPDLAIASDFGTDRLLWNNGDGTFSDGTAAAGVNTAENGMGSTFADYDMDGDLDWFITSIFDPLETCETIGCNWGYTGNRLFRNEGGRVFSDATDEAGVREGGWGWGAGFFDHNNNGFFDLVMTNGFDVAGQSHLAQYINDPMRCWVNAGDGTFTEQSAPLGITDTRSGKGLLLFDYDMDGDQDIFVVNNSSTPVLYRNDTPGGASLRIRFTANGKPYDVKNAKVWVTPVEGGPVHYRETGVSTHFLGQSERTLHIGLGTAPPETIHAIEVAWPGAAKQRSVWNEVPRPGGILEIAAPEESVPKRTPLEPHSADTDSQKGVISLSELLRVLQLSRFSHYMPGFGTEDGYGPAAQAPAAQSGHHDADYAPADWRISLNELLRVVQLFNSGAYASDPNEEDGFLPLPQYPVL